MSNSYRTKVFGEREADVSGEAGPNDASKLEARLKTQVDAASDGGDDDPDDLEIINPIQWTGNNGTASSRRRKREEAEDEKAGVWEAIKRLKAAHEVDGGWVDLTVDED